MLAVTWFILFAGLGVWFGRTQNAVDVFSIDTSAMIQVVSIFLALTLAAIFLMRSFKSTNFSGSLLFMFIYAVIGVAFSPLSEIVTLSAFKAFSLIVAVLIAVCALSILRKTQTPNLLLDVTYFYFTFILLTTVIGGMFFPEYTHRANKGVLGFMLVGWPHLNSNSLSFVAAVVMIVGLRRFFEPDYRKHRFLFFGLFQLYKFVQ